MIFLMVLTMIASAGEPVDRSAAIYGSYCVSCHGENMEKIPLKPETTSEKRAEIIKNGISTMPPYGWMLFDGEAEKLVKFMEQK